MKAIGSQFLMCLLLVGCSSAPHDMASKVPLGTKLADLDRHLHLGAGSEGEVIEWRPTKNVPDDSYRFTRNEFGNFENNKLGSYDLWKATPEERNQFTGEITFVHHGSTSSDVNAFVFIDGKLRKKNWGFLPG